MIRLLRKYKDAIVKKEVTGSFCIMVSNIAIAASSFLLFYLIAKHYGAVQLGIFGFFKAILMLIITFFDQGISLTTIHFFNTYPKERKIILKETFLKRMYFSGAMSIPLFILASPIAVNIFSKPELSMAIRIGAMGIFTGSLVYFNLTVFRAKEMYKHFAIMRFLYFGLAPIVGMIMIFLRFGGIDWIMYSYVIVAAIAFVISGFFINWDFLFIKQDDKNLIIKLIHFGKWALLSVLFFTASRYVLIFLIGIYGSLEEIGQFSLAFQIINGINLIISALTIVLFSYSSGLKNQYQINKFLSKSIKTLTLVSVLIFLGLVLFMKPIMNLFFNKDFQEVSMIVIILFIGQAFFLISFPLKGVSPK